MQQTGMVPRFYLFQHPYSVPQGIEPLVIFLLKALDVMLIPALEKRRIEAQMQKSETAELLQNSVHYLALEA